MEAGDCKWQHGRLLIHPITYFAVPCVARWCQGNLTQSLPALLLIALKSCWVPNWHSGECTHLVMTTSVLVASQEPVETLQSVSAYLQFM